MRVHFDDPFEQPSFPMELGQLLAYFRLEYEREGKKRFVPLDGWVMVWEGEQERWAPHVVEALTLFEDNGDKLVAIAVAFKDQSIFRNATARLPVRAYMRVPHHE